MKNLLAVVLLLGCGLVQAETITTVPAWDGSSATCCFGETQITTHGQTFTLNADSSVDSFTFYLDDRVNPDYVDFEAYIYAWDDGLNRITGASLFSNGPYSTTNNGGSDGFEEFKIITGGVDLSAGKYVAFFSASNLFDGLYGTSRIGTDPTGSYSGGDHVYQNNGSDFASLSNTDWYKLTTIDLAFTIETTAVPIPAAVWLFGSALAGLGWMRRRKTV
jgi:hypothetical protein